MWWKQYIPKPRMFGPWLQDIFDKIGIKNVDAVLPSDQQKPFLEDVECGQEPIFLFDVEMPVGTLNTLYGVSKVCWKPEYYALSPISGKQGPYESAIDAAKAYVRECVATNNLSKIPKYNRMTWVNITNANDTVLKKRNDMSDFLRTYHTVEPYMSRHQMP